MVVYAGKRTILVQVCFRVPTVGVVVFRNVAVDIVGARYAI
jgi:hypothetical protein